MKLIDFALVLIGLGIVVLFTALLSYYPDDPGWSFSFTGFVETEQPRNLVGRFGAVTSDLIYSWFGWAAFLLLFFLGRLFWLLWQRSHAIRVEMNRDSSDSSSDNSSRGSTAMKGMTYEVIHSLAGGTVLLLAGSALCTLLDLPAGQLPQGPGGIIGQIASDPLVNFGSMQIPIAMLGVIVSALVLSNISLVTALLVSNRFVLFTVRTVLSMLWSGLVRIFRFGRRPAAAASGRRAKKAVSKTTSSTDDRASELPAVEQPAAVPAAAEPQSSPQPSVQPSQPAGEDTSGQQQVEQEVAAPSGAQASVFAQPTGKKSSTKPPAADLLESADRGIEVPEDALARRAQRLQQVLADHGIVAEVMEVQAGPVVTRFELQSQPGLKVSRVTAAASDLARELSSESLRVVENIEGTTYFGIELPNETRQVVRLSQAVDTDAFRKSNASLPIALGVDITGEPVLADIAAMPHLMVAGATGSGKSVCIHSLLVSLLLKNSPEQLRLVLIDPKMIELSAYGDLPHLIAPVVTDSGQAMAALNWCVEEMENRYRLLAEARVRDLEGYNQHIKESGEADQHPLPRILVVVDELADLMMVAGKSVEQQIARVAQKARAAGVHLLLATQRPSANVLTGLIKSNIPARIAFQVASDSNSRIILDQGGAQQLLGRGDMLFLPPGRSQAMRVHGAFTSEEEVGKVVERWQQIGGPDWLERLDSFAPVASTASGGEGAAMSEGDEGDLYDQACSYVLESRKTSVSAIQRHLRIGFNRASRLVDQMEQRGVLSPPDGRGVRQIL